MTDLNPSRMAMVPFVSVHNMMRIVNGDGVAETIAAIADRIEADFLRWKTSTRPPAWPPIPPKG